MLQIQLPAGKKVNWENSRVSVAVGADCWWAKWLPKLAIQFNHQNPSPWKVGSFTPLVAFSPTAVNESSGNNNQESGFSPLEYLEVQSVGFFIYVPNDTFARLVAFAMMIISAELSSSEWLISEPGKYAFHWTEPR